MVTIMMSFLAVSVMLLIWMLVMLPEWLEPTGEQPAAKKRRPFTWRMAVIPRLRKSFDRMFSQLKDIFWLPFKETLNQIRTKRRGGFYS